MKGVLEQIRRVFKQYGVPTMKTQLPITFKLETDIVPLTQKLKLHIHLTRTLKRANIYNLYLHILKEHNCLILTSYHVLKLWYGVHAPNDKHLLPCTESLKHNDIDTFCLYVAVKHNC